MNLEAGKTYKFDLMDLRTKKRVVFTSEVFSTGFGYVIKDQTGTKVCIPSSIITSKNTKLVEN